MRAPAEARCLVVAKAPVAGLVKTRLGATVGMAAAAELAAAALLDTIAAARTAYGAARCVCALDGSLERAARGAELRAALVGWRVIGQRGRGLGDRLAHAHRALGPGPVVQIGMDTPQLRPGDLSALEGLLDDVDAALGPAVDGGWWGLALRDPGAADALRRVAMSRPTTGADTRAALDGRGLRVALAHPLRDVDVAGDAELVAHEHPATRFAEVWRTLTAVRT